MLLWTLLPPLPLPTVPIEEQPANTMLDDALKAYTLSLVKNKFLFDVTDKEWASRAETLTSFIKSSSETDMTEKVQLCFRAAVSVLLVTL